MLLVYSWLEKKLNTTYRNDAPIDKMRKIVAFLQRRGYSYSMIRKAVGGILDEDLETT